MNTVDRNSSIKVDLQYVLGNNKQVFVKVLAFMPARTVIPNFFHFKPPYEYNIIKLDNGALKQQHLNQQNVNGLHWYCSHQYLSINPKKSLPRPLQRPQTAHKLQKLNADISETIKDREMGSQI